MMYESKHTKCQLLSYPVKNHKYSYVAVTSEFVLKIFHDAGFVDITLRSRELDPDHPSRIQNPERVGYFHIKGVKAL